MIQLLIIVIIIVQVTRLLGNETAMRIKTEYIGLMMGVYLLLYRYSSLNNERCGGSDETIDYFIPVSSGGTTNNIDPMSYKSIEKIVDKFLPEGIDGPLIFPGNLTVDGDARFMGNTTLLNDNQIHGESFTNEDIDVSHQNYYDISTKNLVIDAPLVKCSGNVMFQNSVNDVHRVTCIDSENVSYGLNHVIDFNTNVEFQGVLRLDPNSPIWTTSDIDAAVGDFYFSGGHLNVDTGAS